MFINDNFKLKITCFSVLINDNPNIFEIVTNGLHFCCCWDEWKLFNIHGIRISVIGWNKLYVTFIEQTNNIFVR